VVTVAEEMSVVEPETTATGVVTVAVTAPSQCPVRFVSSWSFLVRMKRFTYSGLHVVHIHKS
jgi:hypothetical protein